jgi:hypothetical protein
LSSGPRIIKSAAIGCTAATVWVALCVGLFQLFRPFDWGQAKVRALLLVALTLAAFGPLLLVPRVQFQFSPPAWFRRLALAVFATLVLEHVRSTYLSIHDDRRMEMGEIHFRALNLLNRGVNPYATTTVLDYAYYKDSIQFDFVQACGDLPTTEGLKRLQRYWESIDPKEMQALAPHLQSGPECAPARQRMSMAGLKYAPVMLLGYYPLVVLLGRPGIYLTHLMLALGIGVLLVWRQRGRNTDASFSLQALVPLAIVFGPTLLRFLTLRHSDCDLIPTVLGVAGLVILERGHPRAAAIVFGLSVGAKLFPGLLYLPLLLGAPKKAWLWALASIALAFVPFLAWDPTGFLNNIFLFNLTRSGDSTALAGDLSQPAQLLLMAVYLAGLGALILRTYRRGWPASERLAYLVLAHIGLFLTARIFHNNYLIWLFPLYGLWLSDALRRLQWPAPIARRVPKSSAHCHLADTP